MITFPNAKINLGLNITEKREDGYHNIETLFYPINLRDTLEFVVSDEEEMCSFSSDGLAIQGSTKNNLIFKAYDLLRVDYDIPALDIFLLKNIPMGAGLGGGSADAAFMLSMLNEQFNLEISSEKLLEYAARIGADCPFFLINKPIIASGIGNIFSPCTLDLSRYTIFLVKPEIHVNTAEAYGGCKPAKWAVPLQDIIQMEVGKWRELLKNDFEDTVFAIHPKLGEIKELLYSSNAVYSAMSGSGSTIFGLFERDECNKEEIDTKVKLILNNTDFTSYQLEML
ncbi:MAG: 4-(cytidine 5'-diphospho)-2-C-methyl-D-erythritol kinase [bacterium]